MAIVFNGRVRDLCGIEELPEQKRTRRLAEEGAFRDACTEGEEYGQMEPIQDC
eukprot:CAMPEP_0116859800 /NCGR_PEP_ID=MMETSP0418-20121206/22042_1 /TAXON_ID=1158023 /ORGANISM="Astrosyne radiata, Strain 13vi08-1A" /LENGTH=52 /DNA_ID=CAMNT_0004494099 /DNA_START=5 /DNA_END=160 /DNA_ORIENTATION=-